MKVVLAGGSGALGRRLCTALAARGDEPVVLSRTPRTGRGFREVAWDGRTVGRWASELDGADAVINLAGELVDRRPTPANVDLLTRSRVEPTRALVEAAGRAEEPPPVWVQLSTLAIYGDAGDVILTEDSPPADGPPQMTDVAIAWEDASADAPVRRRVLLRTGVVLDAGTPALDRLLGVARWGVGGRIATGRQWVSWLHVDDFVTIALRALDDEALDGVVHATTPGPVRNADLMRELRRVTHRPPAPPTPAPLVHLGSIALRTDPALALTGRRCVPARLSALGHHFVFPELGPALDELTS